MNGVFLLDKPVGITSHTALSRAKRLLGAAKAGHTGSLDPLATGMLPLCLGEATKYSRFFLEANKAYAVSLRLGVKTDTGDSDGEVIQMEPVPLITPSTLEALSCQFIGPQLQVPPMYSALKFQGQRLYHLARKGQIVERQPRPVTIHKIDWCPYDPHFPDVLSFSVECSKGTYIRSLVEDMGHSLGCGAHVIALRRLWVSPFQGHSMVSLETLKSLPEEEREALILPISTILSSLMPTLSLSANEGVALRQGKAIAIDALPGIVSLEASGEFLGIGESLDGLLKPVRLIQF